MHACLHTHTHIHTYIHMGKHLRDNPENITSTWKCKICIFSTMAYACVQYCVADSIIHLWNIEHGLIVRSQIWPDKRHVGGRWVLVCPPTLRVGNELINIGYMLCHYHPHEPFRDIWMDAPCAPSEAIIQGSPMVANEYSRSEYFTDWFV